MVTLLKRHPLNWSSASFFSMTNAKRSKMIKALYKYSLNSKSPLSILDSWIFLIPLLANMDEEDYINRAYVVHVCANVFLLSDEERMEALEMFVTSKISPSDDRLSQIFLMRYCYYLQV